MIAAVCRLADWMAMQLAAALMAGPDGRDPRLPEALKLIESAEFIPAEVTAAKVHFTQGNRFCFDTPIPTPWEQNNIVPGRLYRCAEDWTKHPTILLMHGWNDARNHYARFPSLARQCNRHGLNAATLELPFHFQRRPRELGLWGNFLCPDILRVAEAARQAIAEMRAFAAWLRQQGCPKVGFLGVSLGAWLGGLALCRDDRFACAVLQTPVARLDRLIGEAVFCRSLRPAWQGRPVQIGRLNLTEGRPVIPKENILLIEAVHDLLAPRDTVEELWQAWHQPDIWRLREGHISVLWARGLTARIIQWMAPRLLSPAAK